MKTWRPGVPAILAAVLVWLTLCPVECAQATARGPAEQSPAACHASDVDQDSSEVRCQECWTSSNLVRAEKFQLLHCLAADDFPISSVLASPSLSISPSGSIADPPLLLRHSPVLLI
ncbi:MAG TPA: hypothetical protein VMN76_04540 [Acidobacteriota bacterium]|nr:hypothetical protein [Acidobacteriota bacterium]